MKVDDSRDGFTLLETLIAFLILSTALAISAQAIGIATKSLSISEDRKEVLRVADSLRIETLPRVLRGERDEEGATGALRWKIHVVPVQSLQVGDKGAVLAVMTLFTRSGRAHKFVYFSPDL
ncbi:general secretion pathway protein I [Neorhizobium sp. 2083]|uniref:type IV pilus modification PilV family protein n=1 Tax=Neorhizobium sp. 2083 TaxID=2817762 RepID=UPI00285907D3|nr:prepilin-type N-terminal cleavage/methylation domain-containing protein [Neorhizobium sp. 2083]MDR6821132.1 general secretion pathway protein I [Neorhizobium sp. 2083]